MPFSMVCALWIAPDFSDVEAGKRPPPFVDHSEVDFSAVCTFLEELFPYGPSVTIQVPNDTIDQVTVHLRQAGGTVPTMRCEDFGRALLTQAQQQPDPIVDVGRAWGRLHALSDRHAAPPPTILPFVVTAADFEDAVIWRASTRAALGLPLWGAVDGSGARGAPVNHEGALSAEALAQLERIFGTPFQASAVLDEMYSDPRPAYAGKLAP
jgi:hypothetical protein